MSLGIAKRVDLLNPSATVGLIQKVNELKAQGKDVISFNVGEPDFNTENHINEKLFDAIRSGHTKYVTTNGIIELRNAISKKYKKENHVSYDANQIVISTGAKQALYNTFLSIINEGDEVIIMTPCWVSYAEYVKISGGIVKFVATKDDFQLDLKAIRRVVSAKTKAIIINSPNNPTGCVYKKNDLLEIVELAKENQFYIISDEIYEKLLYDGYENISIASLNHDAYNHTITINGFSKAYSMTGHRIGYACYPNLELAKAATKIQDHTSANSTSFVQYAALEALESNQDFIKEMVSEYERRRNLSFDLLDQIEHISYKKVSGAFYIMIDISYFFGKKYGNATIDNADDVAMYLLEQANIALVTGNAFEAPNFIRFSYSNSQENIKAGLASMKQALNLLK